MNATDCGAVGWRCGIRAGANASIEGTTTLFSAREVSPEAKRVRAERWFARALGGLKKCGDFFGHPGHPSDTEWVCVMEVIGSEKRAGGKIVNWI